MEKKKSYENKGYVSGQDEEKPVEEIDPWVLPEFKSDYKPWKELTTKERIQLVVWNYTIKPILLLLLLYMFICSLSFLSSAFRLLGELTTKERIQLVVWNYTIKPILLLLLLYMFICSLSFLSSAFRLLGGRAAGDIFRDNKVLRNPVAGLMIGVLATVLVQSSSTSTSIVITMVGQEILSVRQSIPIIMGANIGTSVTNTIVSIGQITSLNEFRRAFAGATIHDMFNWLSVIVLLPLEAVSGYLFRLSEEIVKSTGLTAVNTTNPDLLKKITKPFTKVIIQLNKKAIIHAATKDSNDSHLTMMKFCTNKNKTRINCGYLFEPLADKWDDWAIGLLMLFISLLILCLCLMFIVKLLHSLLRGSIAKIIRKVVNDDFPGCCAYFTGYVAILIGAGLTMLVQSSSIFTSSLTPLVGLGIISLDRMYPLTLGSNIGTTTTGLLAAIVQEDNMRESLQVAICHLFFNLSGIVLFYPIPFMRFPIGMAKFLGTTTAKYRWFALMYLFLMFFVFPAIILGLSIPAWYVMAAVLIPILLLIIIIAIIKVLQAKRPQVLPVKMRNWKFLPEWMRSLRPLDNFFKKIFHCCPCYKDQKQVDKNMDTELEKGRHQAMNGKDSSIIFEKTSQDTHM